MVTDGQVRRLRRELDSGTSLALAAGRTGMSHKTARRYRDQPTLPSTRKKSQEPRTYRTRIDPFAEVWPAVEERLQAEPRLSSSKVGPSVGYIASSYSTFLSVRVTSATPKTSSATWSNHSSSVSQRSRSRRISRLPRRGIARTV
jgi:hypothetical protein